MKEIKKKKKGLGDKEEVKRNTNENKTVKPVPQN